MISKQQKLQYGEILRMQMRQKQQRKKLQQIEKRGFQKPINTNIYNSYNQNINIENIIPSQNSYIPPQKQNNIILDRKQLLQKKLESQQYNPFGKGGSGATVKDQYGEIIAFRKPRTITNQNGQVYIPLNYSNIQNNNGMIRQQYVPSIIENRNYQMQQNNFQYQKNQYIQPQIKRLQNYQQSPHTQILRPQYITKKVNSIPTEPIYYQQRRQHQIQKPILYLPTNQYKQESNQLYKKGGRNLLKLENTDQVQLNLKQKQKMQMQRILKQQIQETQLRKKREQLELKMKQRQQQQKYNLYVLQEKRKMQEQEIKRKKQIEKVRLQNQRNKQIKEEMEKQKIKKKKQVEQERLQNQRNKQLKDEENNKVNKQNLQFNQSKIIEPSQQNTVRQKISRQIINQKSNFSSNKQPQLSERESQNEFDYKSRNTQNSRQSRLFKKRQREQRERDMQRRKKDKNLEQVKNQIQKMKQELMNRNQLYKIEFEKIRLQTQKAKYEKQKTQDQINKIKQQLQKKIDNDNERLNIALLKNGPKQFDDFQKRNKRNINVRQQNSQKNFKQHNQKIIHLKYQQNKKYKVIDHFDQGLQSLTGQTLKIPVDLPNNKKLTMSRVQDYAIDNRYLSKKSTQNVIQKKGDIIYEQQNQNYYIQSDLKKQKSYKNKFRDLDQLDKLVENQNKKNTNQYKNQDKQGSMNSVNYEISKQIKNLMKDKRLNYPLIRSPSSNIYANQEQRPNSKLSNAGRYLINEKYGLTADGFTLKSEGTKSTFDIEKVNKNNDRRLQKLKQLGIETIKESKYQHQNDPELKKLDILLSNYQK